MKKALKVSVLTVIAAAGLAGCVQQDWQATYGDGSNTSAIGDSVAKDSAGNAYIAGEATDPNNGVTSLDTFVAAYGAGGTLLWKQTMISDALDFKEKVVADAAGNVFVAVENVNSQTTLYKFDAQGTLQNSWQVAVQDGSDLGDLKIGPDQNLYISLGFGRHLLVYSGMGELVWQHSDPQAMSTTSGITEYFGKLDFDNGQVVQASAVGVTLFDAQGQVQSTQMASALGVTNITGLVAIANGVDVLGFDSQQLKLVRLDSDLNVVNATVVGAFEGEAKLASAGNNLCVSNTPGLQSNTSVQYHMLSFTPDGTQLFDTVVTTGIDSMWIPGELKGNAGGCDMLELYENAGSNGFSSTLTHVSTAGKLVNTIQNRSYAVMDFLLTDNDVFEVGSQLVGNSGSVDTLLKRYTRF